jgi:glycosyltransferase involved in cell wall biosynthesis
MRRLLESAAAVTSPSPFLKDYFASLRPDIRLVRNGLYLERYRPKGMTAARPKLVWIRAYEQRYNPVLALEVVSLLAADFPDVDLVMAGPDVGDWSAEQTRAEARNLGVQERVRVLGAIPKEQVPVLLQEGDIFLNTTNVDNAPVTVIEAMACGLCVVSTNAGGVPNLVEDGRDALLVPQRDAGSMAAAVSKILTDPQLAADLSHSARRSAEAYDWDGVFSEWEELLTGLAGRQSGGDLLSTTGLSSETP